MCFQLFYFSKEVYLRTECHKTWIGLLLVYVRLTFYQMNLLWNDNLFQIKYTICSWSRFRFKLNNSLLMDSQIFQDMITYIEQFKCLMPVLYRHILNNNCVCNQSKNITFIFQTNRLKKMHLLLKIIWTVYWIFTFKCEYSLNEINYYFSNITLQ